MSIKVALNKAVENTTLRERFFTTPCALQVRTGASSAGSGNPWDTGAAQAGARGRPIAAVSGKGGQVSQKKQKKGKGGKGGKSYKNGHTPDGREVCFAYNGEGCNNHNCARLHVCRRCFGNHNQANCTVPAAAKRAKGSGG